MYNLPDSATMNKQHIYYLPHRQIPDDIAQVVARRRQPPPTYFTTHIDYGPLYPTVQPFQRCQPKIDAMEIAANCDLS